MWITSHINKLTISFLYCRGCRCLALIPC